VSDHVCPVCGDPSVYALWVDKEPPDECPLGATDLTRCELAMEKARQAALFRRVCPESFDASGNIRAGELGIVYVLGKVFEIEPNLKLIIGAGIPEEMLKRAGKL
jgi:hypothetical protein